MNGGKVDNKKKAKRTALQRISPQMAPDSDESYHDNYGVTQHMDDGGEIADTHDPTTAAMLQNLSTNPKAAALNKLLGVPQAQPTSASSPVQPSVNKWNDPNYIKQLANKAAQHLAPPPKSNVDDEGYSTYKKATPDYADGGEVSPDDSSVDFDLSDDQKQAMSDYLDPVKQQQARANAINQLAQITPEESQVAQNMALGSMGGINDVSEKLSPELLAKLQSLLKNPKQMIQTQGAIDPQTLQQLRDLIGQTGPVQFK